MKIRLMNYSIYEYSLMQGVLDQMTAHHYYPTSIHLVTIFKKEPDTKENLVVDVFLPKSKEYEEKMREQQAFLDPYLDRNYNILYVHNGLYVFNGKETPPEKYCKRYPVPTKRKSLKPLFLFVLTVIVAILFSFAEGSFSQFTKQLTYGSSLLPYGLMLLLFSLIYRYYNTFLGIYRFGKSTSHLSIKHIIKTWSLVIATLLIIGALVEDLTNAKTIDPYSSDVPTAQMLSIPFDNETLSLQHSFVVKDYYHLRSYKDDEMVLSVKKYVSNDCDYLYDQILQTPTLIYCDSVEQYDNYSIGIVSGCKNTIIKKSDHSILVVNTINEINEDLIKVILKEV